MGCKDAILPEPLRKSHTVNCLTYEKNTRHPYKEKLFVFHALVIHLHGDQQLEKETSRIFNLFISKLDRLRPPQFQGVHMNDIPVVEDFLHMNNFLNEIDIVDEKK